MEAMVIRFKSQGFRAQSILNYWAALSITIGLEVGTAILVTHFFRDPSRIDMSFKSPRVWLGVAAVNCLSHPWAWLAVTGLQTDFYLAELAVVAFEAVALRVSVLDSWRSACTMSIATNIVSAAVGLIRALT